MVMMYFELLWIVVLVDDADVVGRLRCCVPKQCGGMKVLGQRQEAQCEVSLLPSGSLLARKGSKWLDPSATVDCCVLLRLRFLSVVGSQTWILRFKD